MAIRYELKGHVAVITLDYPEKLNAIDVESWHDFSRATEDFLADETAWVGIITGAGDRAFCAGADVGSTIQSLLEDPSTKPYPAPPTIMRGQQVDKPLIAAINGLALGGGLEVALACDIRIAARKARLGLPEVSLGIIPAWGGTQRLPRQVPWAIAARMILTGEPISAEEALAVGLVNVLVEPEELMAEAERMAAILCSRGPLALRSAKKAMVKSASLPLDEGLALENNLFLALADTKDARHGIEAFLARRSPTFEGR